MNTPISILVLQRCQVYIPLVFLSGGVTDYESSGSGLETVYETL